MSISSWGNYPKIKSKTFSFRNPTEMKKILEKHSNIIPYGNGRSYGDSALNSKIVKTKNYNTIISFDKENGILHTESGVLLSEIIELILPYGWFLQTVPGTKLITVGGAIASDVHGKNHHKYGCFSECVKMLNLMLPSGKVVKCSKEKNSKLFKSTCGGMGLTGIILDSKISLKKINSQFINQKTIRTKNLKETFKVFEKHSQEPYSVAWIDCLAKDKNLGRSLLMVGDFCNDANLNYKKKTRINIPFTFPSFLLNKYTVRIFNWFYYYKSYLQKPIKKVNFESFFFPLDSIRNWNRIYGKEGFTQYQFIIPKSLSFKGLEEILKVISESGKGSFLAVLKLCGKENKNYISFPLEGYSLALDFKIEEGLFDLLDQLDQIMLKYKGRIYLSKDVRLSKKVFELSYPNIDLFKKIRKMYSMDKKFNSLQSKRLDL